MDYYDVLKAKALRGGTGGGGFTPTQSQLDAMNSGITAEDAEQISTNKNNISLKANTSDVNTTTANLQTQIDQIAQAAGSGTADTEVAQARIGADGTSYQTLKARLDGENSELKEDLTQYNSVNLLSKYGTDFTSRVSNGIRITFVDKENCTLVGTATGYANFSIFDSRTGTLPTWLKNGEKYYAIIKRDDEKVRMQIYWYNGTTQLSYVNIDEDTEFTVPSTANGLIIRIRCESNNKTFNANVSFGILTSKSNRQLTEEIKSLYPRQEIVNNNYINQYTTEHFENSYTLSATPEITSDTNNYLPSTGTYADRSADIMAMLTATGVCHLGQGRFRAVNLQIGDGQMIIGSGKGTVLELANAKGDTYLVKMMSNSTIKDLTLKSETSISVSDTATNRHAILIEGNADGSADDIPQRVVIDNVYIHQFSGGGITLVNTGQSVHCSTEVTNVHMRNCNVGINIPYFSEFNKFTNVRADSCYYGCVNNGGNNVFVNCDFSANKCCFLMDNAQNQSPNNSHGSAIGCIFDHADSNNGIGIKILNCDNGFTFTGCQIFYSKVYISESDGVVIADSIFGARNTDITIDGGGVALFANNLHGEAPTITVNNNNMVHFVNCYVRSTGAVVSN